MMNTSRRSIVFKVDDKLLQSRPPRLLFAATLNTLSKQVKSGRLDPNLVVDILNENKLLPYVIGHNRDVFDISLGRNTNASKVGDIIASEECIRGTYELCISFLEFVLAIINDSSYRDASKNMLASLAYICNEIYTSHHIWTYKNAADMDQILCLCTGIFHQVISLTEETTHSRNDYTSLQLVCIINLSSNQAHKQLLDVIVGGKKSIKKKIDDLNLTDESKLGSTPIVKCIRQSLLIFNKLLTHGKLLREFCDNQGSQPNYQHGTPTASMTDIEKALFDTSIRPGLLQHLFSYIYQSQDNKTACIAVDLIKNIAKKFSMSLMACLGSEADKVCEFFLECLSRKDASVDLEVAILDLLSTCVKHQPGLIELFLNFKSEGTSDAESSGSLKIVVNRLKDCRDRKENPQRTLHTYLMKFVLTFWQKNHSATEQFDNANEFWESITDPLIKFLERDQKGASTGESEKTTGDACDLARSLEEELNSYSLMILAREIFSLNAGVATERKINPDLGKRIDELSSKNFVGKYSTFVKRRYTHISSNLDKGEDYCRTFMAWRDFLTSYSKFKTSDLKSEIKTQIIADIMSCMAMELKLGEKLDKERASSIGEALLLVWSKWMPESIDRDNLFDLVHELLYLTDSCKENLPFSFLMTFQSTLNLYLVRNRDYLIKSKRAFDLMVPALQLMHFSLKVVEKHLDSCANRTLDLSFKPGIESRLCQASIMTLRFIIDVSREQVELWIAYIQTNLKTDALVQFLTLLMNKRVRPEICLSLVELLLCMSSVPQAADYLNKATLIDQVNLIAVSAYERPYAHLSQLAATSHLMNPVMQDENMLPRQPTSDINTSRLDGQVSPMDTFGANGNSGAANVIPSTLSDTTKIYLDNLNSDHNWLPIYWHVIRLNISMILTLGSNCMYTAVEFLAIHCIRICEVVELLRTKPRSVHMEEALLLINMIDLVLRCGCVWKKRNAQSYDAISDEIGKTAYTLATSALPPPTSSIDDKSKTSTSSLTTIKPRDCLVYAKCCYNFGKYTEAERVLFQTKFGDKSGFIKEAAQIYGNDLSIFAFHLASLICLKTNRRSDSIDFALQVFEDDVEYADIVNALKQNQI